MMRTVQARYFNRVHRYRLQVALAASLCAHWAVGTTFGYRTPADLPTAGTAPFEVRIHAASSGDAPSPDTAMPTPTHKPPVSMPPATVLKQDLNRAARQAARVMTDETVERSMHSVARAPSTEYYSAHELDIYPQLRAPLKFD